MGAPRAAALRSSSMEKKEEKKEISSEAVGNFAVSSWLN
jgi:hypothetical protein